MMDPVLGPLNSYERGGPAALSPYNNNKEDVGLAIICKEEIIKDQ